MLYPDRLIVKRLRQQDPHGIHSNAELERTALLEQLRMVTGNVQDRVLQDILETFVSLL